MGGLAYDLTTKLCSGFLDWNLLFTNAPHQLVNGDFMQERWLGISLTEIATGNSCFDVRIRGSHYINDNYFIYGSYRAEFSDLYGAGNDGIAWDGFVMIIPAWNIHARFAADLLGTAAQWQEGNGYYIYPCRMPFTLAPAAADAVVVNDDSTPGVYSVAGLMGSNLTNVDVETAVSFYYVGHQRTYAANGTLTGQDYVGAGGIVLADIAVPSPVDVGPVNYMNIICQEQFGWGLTTALAATGMTPGPAEWVPKFAYAIEDYSVAFQIPTGVIAADSLSGRDYYISRIYDIASLSNFDGASPTPVSNGAGMICGEVVKDDGAGAVDYTTVMTGIFFPECCPEAITGYATGAYGLLKTGTDENFGLEDNLPTGAYNLEGAYAVAIQPGLQRDSFGSVENIFTVGINNVTHGGNPFCELYIGSVTQCIYGHGYPLLAVGALPYIAVAFACQGGAFTTATGLALPITGSQWTGVALQQSTFLPLYERASKGQSSFQNPVIPSIDKQYILDEDLAEDLTKDPTIQGTGNDYLANALCGVGLGGSGNVMIRGLSNKSPPSATDFYSNVAYGWLAYQPADEPYVLMYDWASWRVLEVLPQTTPPTWNQKAAGSSEGIDMNDNFTIDPNSTTRYPLSASWDNDRDQWIFGFADATNGFGIMSVNSAFSNTSETQLSFLDQTDDYAIPAVYATPEATHHTARMMTPILDGLTIMAETNDLTDPGRMSLTPYITGAGGPDQVTTFILFTINGTTGRTANVWVDYLLFDGVDSMIALELQKLGLRVNVENVEWYRAKLLRKGHLGLTSEEIEDWMRQQQDEYKATQRLNERQGRQRIKRRQVAAWKEGLEDSLKGEFLENGGYDSIKEFDTAAAEYVPEPNEESPDMNRYRNNKSTKRKNKR